MFRRFRGLGPKLVNCHMWFFVMQSRNALGNSSQLWLSAGLSVLALMAAPQAYAAGAVPKEAGVWIDDSGKGAVKIELCGAKLCGRIVWLRDPLNPKGEPLFDKNNPEPGQRARPICGLPTLGNLQQMPEGGFDGGWVYDPKDGNSYSVALDLKGPNELQVTGYKGMRFLGKSFIWTRAKTELPSCNVQPAAAKAAPAGAAAATAAPVAKPAAAAVKAPAAAPAAATKAVSKTGDKAVEKAAPKKATEALPWDTPKAAAPASAQKTAPAGAANLGAGAGAGQKLPSQMPAAAKAAVGQPAVAKPAAAKPTPRPAVADPEFQ